tara:strand:- start:372 stop:1085 length:714 start_codon:yes stop_codon:yes gene_type:complete
MPEQDKRIKVARVEGLVTHFDVDPSLDLSEDYKVFLAARRLSREYNSNSRIRQTVSALFSDFIGGYLTNYGLSIGRYRTDPPQAYLREDNGVEIICQDVEIAPESEIISGRYRPRLEFTACKDSLSATSSLEQNGSWELKILQKILNLKWADGDGFKTPKVQLDSEDLGKVHVASLKQIPRVLSAMKKLYSRIPEQTFVRLSRLSNSIDRVKDNGEASELLQAKYDETLRFLVPDDL